MRLMFGQSRACASAVSFIQARDISSLGRTSTKVGARRQRHSAARPRPSGSRSVRLFGSSSPPQYLSIILVGAAVKRQRRLARRHTVPDREPVGKRRRAATANACSSSRAPTSWQILDTMSAPVGEARKAAARQLVLLPRQAVFAALQQRPRDSSDVSASRDTRIIRPAVPISSCIVTNRLALSW